jgi:hypothetical protein
MPVLDVLILYEDLGTGLRAKRSLDLLAVHLHLGPGFSIKLWRSDLLRERQLKEHAVIEASAADVILLSLHGRGGLPDAVRGWMNRWLDHKEDRPYALGVLLDPEAGYSTGDSPVMGYLREVAGAACADLFFGFCETPICVMDSARAEITKRHPRRPPTLEKIRFCSVKSLARTEHKQMKRAA